jgi:hypothetical protein
MIDHDQPETRIRDYWRNAVGFQAAERYVVQMIMAITNT